MNCIQTQPFLDAYADHALNAWQTFRVRRHLAGCAACAAQLADIQRLDASVRAWRSVSAPAALEGRIAAALPRTVYVPTQTRDRRVARRAAVGLAGVAAAIGAGFWLLPGKPSQPTIALADVEQAMASVKIMAEVDDTTDFDKDGKILDHHLDQQWIRRNPPAIATMNLLKTGETQDKEMLEDSRGLMAVMSDGSYFLSKGNGDDQNSRMISGYINLSTQTLSFMAQLDSRLGKKGLIRGQETVLNGLPTLKFDNTWQIKLPKPMEMHYTIWLDPKTKRMMRLQGESFSHGILTSSGSSSKFRYDEVPPPGVFDIVPPTGARVVDQRTLRVYRQK